MEVLDKEEDSFGIRGKLAILLMVGAFGSRAETDRLAGTGVAGVVAAVQTVKVRAVDDGIPDMDGNCEVLRRFTKFSVEFLRSKTELLTEGHLSG